MKIKPIRFLAFEAIYWKPLRNLISRTRSVSRMLPLIGTVYLGRHSGIGGTSSDGCSSGHSSKACWSEGEWPSSLLKKEPATQVEFVAADMYDR